MASVAASPTKGRRKDLNADLNLVPFIDILSMCICFLLMTAVWVEIGNLEIKQSHGTDGQASAINQAELSLVFQSENSIKLQLKQSGKIRQTVLVQGQNEQDFKDQLNGAIANSTKGLREAIAAAFVTTHPNVSYGRLVSAVDALRRNKVANVGILPSPQGGS